MTDLDAHGGWPSILGALADGESLTAEVTRAVLGTILAGDATDAQIAAFIVALRIKGETVEELTGLQGAMLDAATPLHLPAGTIDIVGMGGASSRRVHALNVSTIAAFVAAGAGAIVCKHGNRKASSTSGSFDLLEALGVTVEITPEALEAQVRDIGIGFAFARTFHPAMRHVGPVRAELGVPTVFNILGPLSHPARLEHQVVGVADWSLAESAIRVLAATGSQRALVVHGDGLDELTTVGPSRMFSLEHGEITELTVDATEFGLPQVALEALAGGDAARNAELARRVLDGERGPIRDIVVLNAGAGLVVAGRAADLGDGVVRAQEAIDDGRALAKLETLRGA